MGVQSRKPERVRRQAMPVAISIQWKPLRDSHYVIASLQPGGAGMRQIFVRQSTLREVQAIARGDQEQPVVGLLLGERLACSLTLTPYLLIESHVEATLASLDERAISDAIRTLRGHVGGRNSVEVLGWYCNSRSPDAVVSRTQAAVHATCFTEPWQTVLIFGGGNTGAFFLYDSRAARWFHAPFYEVADTKREGADSKATAGRPRPRASMAGVPNDCVRRSAGRGAAGLWRCRRRGHSSPRRPRHRLASVPLPSRGSSSKLVAHQPAMRSSEWRCRLAGRLSTSPRSSVVALLWRRGARRRASSGFARRWRRGPRSGRPKPTPRGRERRRGWQRGQPPERRAAREDAQRRAAEEEKRRAAEAEARRTVETEARRKAAEEAERRRAVEAETRRQAAEAEAQRRAEEAEARRAAEAEAQRKAAEEAKRKAGRNGSSANRGRGSASARRPKKRNVKAAETEARRIAAVEAQRKAGRSETQKPPKRKARRVAAVEAQRKAAEEAKLKAAETEARRNAAEEAQRKAAAKKNNAAPPRRRRIVRRPKPRLGARRQKPRRSA